MKVRTLREAARFVDDVGLAFVFPDGRTPLPSLWGAVGGRPLEKMDGEGLTWTPRVARAWDLKDELGARRRAYFGRFIRGKGTLIALDLLPPMAALVMDGQGLSAPAREAYERLGNVGAMSTLRLRESLRLHGPRGNAAFDRILLELFRRLLIANVGIDESETRWPAAVVDRLDRAYPSWAGRAARLSRPRAVALVRRRLPRLAPRFLASITRTPPAVWRTPSGS